MYLEPSSVKEELQQGENGNIHVQLVVLVSLLRVQKLPSNEAESKEGVYCNSYDLETGSNRGNT